MKFYILGTVLCIIVLGFAVYYGYTYYMYKYRSEERKLRVTRIGTFRSKTTTMYCVAGELVDMPGIEMSSLEYYTAKKLKVSEGDIITVRYIGGQQFMVDPNSFLKNMIWMIVFFILTVIILFFYKK